MRNERGGQCLAIQIVCVWGGAEGAWGQVKPSCAEPQTKIPNPHPPTHIYFYMNKIHLKMISKGDQDWKSGKELPDGKTKGCAWRIEQIYWWHLVKGLEIPCGHKIGRAFHLSFLLPVFTNFSPAKRGMIRMSPTTHPLLPPPGSMRVLDRGFCTAHK